MGQEPEKLRVLLICGVLAVVTFAAFEQVRRSEFINFDDDEYVTENPQVKAGITCKSVFWAFTTQRMGNWHPLTWLSHMLDCQLFGLNASWHHLMSLLFHIANTLLLFLVLTRMTGAFWPSGFVAAAFALHPLHVESVAWVAERKDVLSGFFWMLTMLAYVRYAERPAIGRYLLVVLAFCLGLMAKPILVTLPFVLLLLDYWPLGRLQRGHQSRGKALSQSKLVKVDYQRLPARRLIAEKIPLFVLAAVSSVVTFIVQQGYGAVAEIRELSLDVRIANAVVCYVGYIIKMVYPVRLAVLYPLRVDGLPMWQVIVSVLILAGVSAAVIYTARRRRYLAVGWLWYLGVMVPVIGLVQVGSQAMADRYTYLPLIGIFIMVGWGGAEFCARRRYRRIGLRISACVVLAVLLLCTRRQVRYWQNSLSLFERTLAVTKNNFMIYNNYGLALIEKGLHDEAIEQLNKSLRTGPRGSSVLSKVHRNLATIYYEQGKFELAIRHWTETIRLKPDSTAILNDLAWVLATTEDTKLRDSTRAVGLARRACELSGYENPAFLDTLAAAYASVGRFSEAVAAAEKALELAQSLEPKGATEQIRSRLDLYKANQPYTEPLPVRSEARP